MNFQLRIISFFWFVCLLSALVTGCGKDQDVTPLEPIPFEYTPTADQTILDMISWEQAGHVDSLDGYLNHRNPAYRYQALHTYTCVRGEDGLNKLLPLLRDSVKEVKQRAIYAIGQLSDKAAIPHLLEVYDAWDSLRHHQTENALILEAIGKCGARPQLEQLAGISTFEPADSILIKGQALGLFQLLLKGLHNEASVETMTKYFFGPQQPLSVRQIAGYYLTRGQDLELDKYEFSFGKILRSSDPYTLRTYAAGVMANSGNRKYANILTEQLGREKNDQVKLNMLRALYKMPYSRVKNKVFDEINNKNPLISRMASRFFLINGQQDDAAQYWDKVKNKKLDPITTAYFAAATVKNLPFYYALTRNSAIQAITSRLKNSSDPYIKSQLLQVLAELPEQVNVLTSYYTNDAHPVIKSQVVFSVQKAAQVARKNNKFINTVNRAARILFNRIIEDKDSGALAAMAYTIRDTASTNFHAVFRKKNSLIPLLDSLDLPREIETYNELAMLINSYGDLSVSPVEASNFAPFDKERYAKISDATRAFVRTSAGDFTMSFYYKNNPISVTNFINLTEQGYFTDKIFHRVVPNFVIQTGCPRGDGYGSQDYVIRSELDALHYDRPGKIGMASAGNDTESSQWFVTHLPVYHLDGRYTIFGQITDGMDIINSINIGDKINSIEIIN